MQNQLEELKRLSPAHIRANLAGYAPRDLADSGSLAHAAVALIVREEVANGETELLMIRRAEHPHDPWSGHMGFPGGRVEAFDASAEAAAIRETEEELGVRLAVASEPLGRLSELRARSQFKPIPLSIFPFLFRLTHPVPLHLNEEVVEAIWIPLSFFLQRENRVEVQHRLTHDQPVPCCLYAERIIWGLSLGMVDELLFKVLQAERP